MERVIEMRWRREVRDWRRGKVGSEEEEEARVGYHNDFRQTDEEEAHPLMEVMRHG